MLKHFLLSCFLLSSFSFAQTKPAGKPARQEPSARSTAQRVEVPKGATQVSPGLYRMADASGKNWLYRQTPFGVMRFEETAGQAGDQATSGTPVATGEPTGNPFNANDAGGAGATPDVKVKEQGDSIQFERSTPFGPVHWTKKKSELNADETAVWERSRAPKGGNSGPKE